MAKQSISFASGELFIGQIGSKSSKIGGNSSALVISPPGTGKGVCLTIPNMVLCTDSMIVHDVKGENYNLTQKFRSKMGQEVFYWNPLSLNTNKFNPLDEIRWNTPYAVDDIYKISSLLIIANDAISTSSRGVLNLILLYLACDNKAIRNFGYVVNILSDNLFASLLSMLKKVKKKFPEVSGFALETILLEDNPKRFKILQNLLSHLEPWQNPLISNATSKSDFKISEFQKKKISLYVIVQPSDIKRLSHLLNFFYRYALDILMRQQPLDSDIFHGVRFILDEFCSLGKIEGISGIIPYFRSYKIALLPMIYSIEDLESVYGQKEASAIMAVIPYKICFAANSYYTANVIAAMLSTHKKEVSPSEIMTLSAEKILLLQEGQKVETIEKVKYFENEALKDKIS